MKDIEREGKIVDYLSNHEGCSPERAYEALKGNFSRQKYFKLLKNLKERDAIRDEWINKRDKALYVNKDDIVVVVTRRLGEFEQNYFELLEKIFTRLENETKRSEIEYFYNSLYYTIMIFYDMVKIHSYLLSIYWPLSISDKKKLETLQVVTLAQMSELYTKFYEILRKHNYDDILNKGYFEQVLKSKRKRSLEEIVSMLLKLDIDIEEDKEPTINWYKRCKLDVLARKALNSLPSLDISS